MSNAFRPISDSLHHSLETAAPTHSAVADLPPYADADCAEADTLTSPFLEALDLSPAAVLVQQSNCVRLDWEDLPPFAVVDRQFEQWGVLFANAIAICPSNPAYPPYSGRMAIMGAPKGGWLEAKFVRPVKCVSTFVTSSRRTVLSAYDAENRLIASAETPAANLAESQSACPPNALLQVRSVDIHRVTFHAFDGQFILDDFCFCF
ncbi:hypothetical protein [Leptolyngbya ohadii]|uniref:hypothetical protein n=1 Tax=Leptolyngbya ohadii TaxID=1962290 RepID=UPI000B59E6D6|nr:hypothetical protein [Leptolyngbya ohadii]